MEVIMFKIHSKYTPTGDQPEAIRELTENIKMELKIKCF